jgi:hypothetical protein
VEVRVCASRHETHTDFATGNDSTLTRIARVRNAKAEIHWTSNVLRITADKVTAEYTADDIEAALSKTHSKTFTPEHWKGLLAEQQVSKRSSLSDSLPLDYVSSLTGTYIAKDNNNKDTVRSVNSMLVCFADDRRYKYMGWMRAPSKKQGGPLRDCYLSRSPRNVLSILKDWTLSLEAISCQSTLIRNHLTTSTETFSWDVGCFRSAAKWIQPSQRKRKLK